MLVALSSMISKTEAGCYNYLTFSRCDFYGQWQDSTVALIIVATKAIKMVIVRRIPKVVLDSLEMQMNANVNEIVTKI